MMDRPKEPAEDEQGDEASKWASLPWLRIGVEGLAIVASILLAFTIDAWWAERVRAAEVEKIMATLEADLLVSQEMLEVDRVSWEAILKNTSWLLQSTVADTAPRLYEFVIALCW